MRKTFLLLLSLLALSAPRALAEGHWIAKAHDFGAFDEEMGTVYCTFSLVNTGTEPLAITSARANCGCTRPEYSTEPVAPGDTLRLRVGFDPKGRPGKFMKRITVDCSDAPRRSNLTISGTVIGSSNTLRSRFPVEAGPVRLRSTVIPYGKVLKGEVGGQYLDAYNASSDTIRPAVGYTPKYINAMVQPKAIAPGENFIISTVLHPDYTREWGAVTDSILFYPTGDLSAEPVRIETVAIIAENFSKLTPQQRAEAPLIDTSTTAIDLERLSRSERPVRHSFEIENQGKSPLLIRKISCPDPAVTVTLKKDKIAPGKKARVDVTVNPADVRASELLNARINIISNDPDHSSLMVRVVAEMTD